MFVEAKILFVKIVKGHEQLWGSLANLCVPSSLENW